jgi:hypothetical protein
LSADRYYYNFYKAVYRDLNRKMSTLKVKAFLVLKRKLSLRDSLSIEFKNGLNFFANYWEILGNSY